jgi:hypothetical protein
MPMPKVLLQPPASASTTDPFSSTVGSFHHRQVFAFEWVSVLAAHLPGVHRRRPDSAQRVLSLRDWFEVIRIHTAGIAADVVEVLARGKRPNKRDVRQSVGSAVLALEPVIPVPVLDGGSPVPAAAGLVDLAPEAAPQIHNRLPFYRGVAEP